jgi:hypothetical protein
VQSGKGKAQRAERKRQSAKGKVQKAERKLGGKVIVLNADDQIPDPKSQDQRPKTKDQVQIQESF